ncbi:MAG TPA: BLUF domain-containing protein [Amaricoccus sp.]|uniref:BLUF domain-containing protein n=1 Tax=Amaricoccus sp. TaxID=1872485 RepID=UPI002C5B2B4C|nr:BLUF domain-containing protein [Amaricoccus sp.]HMQ93325.1 BLUF domain-containing protein [Amaricoccus sp.]HMR54103.1 BLUF domain-containing protein [Amaricoccus sp.]HMR60427.1 BLUF domain-containing protein [Amaricoccus sp.]HMU01120.1 BLUF domain-containing protein [Amaricoccus sp.]
MPNGSGAISLVEFSYASEATSELPPSALLRLEAQARRFNLEHGLTGELRFDGRSFTQVLEGCWSAIMPLSARILTDRRHGSISITAFRPIPARRFTTWSSAGFGVGEVAALRSASAAGNLRFLPLVPRLPLEGDTENGRETARATT